MAITTDDFNKIWASTSPLTPYSFSASQYKEGWNFIGGTPPSRQMWDFLQKNNDEKMQYLLNHFDNYLPLSGGRMTGELTNIGSTAIPINIKTPGTDYRDIQIESSDGKHRIAAIRASKTSEGRCEIMIGASTTSNAAPAGITISRSTTNIYATAPTPNAGDNSTKIATTEFVNATALTYQQKKFNEPSKWEDNTIQSIARAFPDDHPAFAYEYGVKVTLGKIRSEEGHTNLYFPHNGGMYLKNYWDRDSNTSGWLTMLTDQNYSNFALPKVVGAVVAFAGRTTPRGWLLCDGSAVSRTDYEALYAVIGTTYGAGNGSTTFNLPNLVDKFVEGSATAGTVKSAGLPNITGNVKSVQKTDGLANGVFSQSPIITFYYDGSQYEEANGGTMRNIYLYFDASKSNAIYGKSNTVQPPALTMRYIIKY